MSGEAPDELSAGNLSGLQAARPVGGLLRAAVIAIAAGLAACANPSDQPPPPVAAAAPPANAPADTPPVPLRKPTPPRPPAAAPTPTAVEPPKPAPPPEQTASLPPPEPVGMTDTALAGAFGQPAARRDSPPAVIWQYVDGDCSLDVYLYRDVQTDALHALYVELDGNDRSDQRRQFCLRRLVQHSDRIGG